MNVQHIETEASDHSALMLSPDAEPIRKKKRFYFDKRWIEHEGVENIISKAWSYDCNGFEQSQVSFKIKHCCRSLVAWLSGVMVMQERELLALRERLQPLGITLVILTGVN